MPSLVRKNLITVAACCCCLAVCAGRVVAAPAPAPAPGPDAGEVQALFQHRRSGVVTAQFANGATVHYRRITTHAGQAEVVACFFGGRLLEEPREIGVTRLTGEVIEQVLDPDRAAPGSTAPGEARFDALTSTNALGIRFWGPSAEVERAAMRAGVFFRSPRTDSGVVERARAQATQDLAAREKETSTVIGQALVDLIYPPEEARARAIHVFHVEHVSAADVQQCLDRHFLGGAPVEVAVVGDLPLEQALQIGRFLVGGLPARARAGPAILDALRSVARPEGPLERTVTLATPSGTAVVLAGFLGLDSAGIGETRQMRAAARVLQARARERLAGAGIVGSEKDCGAEIFLSPFKGFGMVLLSAEVEDARAHDANTVLNDEIDRITMDGPTPEELARASEELAREVEKFDGDSRYWAGLLARCGAQGIEPDEIAGGAAFYRSLTPQAVLEPLRRLWTPGSRIGLVIRAESPRRPDAP